MRVPGTFARLAGLLCIALQCAPVFAVAIAPPARAHKAAAIRAEATRSEVPAVTIEKKGMTWGVGTPVSTSRNIVFVSCHGQPRVDGHGCEAYVGDTACSHRLPLLCLNTDGRAHPASLLTPHAGGVMPDSFYSGWAAGRVALSKPAKGSRFRTRADADAFCASGLGEGWRIAEHHDGIVDVAGGHGGWGFVANGRLAGNSRFWVAINDTSANCWDPIR